MEVVDFLIKGYLVALIKYPVTVKSMTAAWAMCIADILSQKLEYKFAQKTEQDKDINWLRVLRVTVFVALFGAPILHYYYLSLEYLFPGDSSGSIIAKVICDLFLFTPISVFGFFVGLGVMEGQSMQKIQAELETNYFPTLKTGFTLWPVASMVNFWFVPVNYRLFFTGGISLIWNCYLSFMKSKGLSENEEPVLPVSVKPHAHTPPGPKKLFPLFPGKVSVT